MYEYVLSFLGFPDQNWVFLCGYKIQGCECEAKNLHKMPMSISFSSNVKGEIDSLAIPFENIVDPIVFKAKK
jgi:hypothetical protein